MYMELAILVPSVPSVTKFGGWMSGFVCNTCWQPLKKIRTELHDWRFRGVVSPDASMAGQFWQCLAHVKFGKWMLPWCCTQLCTSFTVWLPCLHGIMALSSGAGHWPHAELFEDHWIALGAPPPADSQPSSAIKQGCWSPRQSVVHPFMFYQGPPHGCQQCPEIGYRTSAPLRHWWPRAWLFPPWISGLARRKASE